MPASVGVVAAGERVSTMSQRSVFVISTSFTSWEVDARAARVLRSRGNVSADYSERRVAARSVPESAPTACGGAPSCGPSDAFLLQLRDHVEMHHRRGRRVAPVGKKRSADEPLRGGQNAGRTPAEPTTEVRVDGNFNGTPRPEDHRRARPNAELRCT